jgi:uncharacterized membrane protein YhaH (DUF805 family)
MTWQSVFFSANGRMGRNDFWIAALILFGAGFISMFLHALAVIAWLVIWYCWICIGSKRLHDAGRSGWLVLIPVLAGFVAGCLSAVIGGAAAISAIASGGQYDPGSLGLLWGSLGLAAMLFSGAGLVNLVFLLWVGLSAGDASDNRYGPPPSPWLKSAAPPPAPAA